MTDEAPQTNDEKGTPAEVVWHQGVGYENDNVPCEVHCLVLDDGGVQWVFRRGGREMQVRLSHTAMEAVFSLWQQALWQAPPLPIKTADSPEQRSGDV